MNRVEKWFQKKKLDSGWVGMLSTIQIYFGCLEFFHPWKAPYTHGYSVSMMLLSFNRRY